MKIAILVYNLTGGGAERVAVIWASGFHYRGHEVCIVTFNDQAPKTYGLIEGVEERIVVSHKSNRVLRVLERIVKLRRTLSALKPDVVIEVMTGWERLVAMAGMKCVKIATEHNVFELPKNAEHKLNWKRKYLLNRLYDHVTVLTQADKDVIGNRLKHVSVLPNPLALKPAPYVPTKDKVILAVGRKDDWHCKGFDNLIRAWAQVAKSAEGWKLQIVGSSPKGGQKYLGCLCQECGVENCVEFPEYQDEILPYYQRASIFVLSSRYEGFGLVLIEAMSQGCACIACDYKGRQSEIVTNDVSGVTCEPDNVEALAGAIRKVIEDNELRVRLQAAAIRRAGDFSINNIMTRWDGIFKKCNIIQ